jgi:ClpP class serine protease
MKETSALIAIGREVNQTHELRKPLLEKLQKLREGRAIVSFFIGFQSNVPLMQSDADMIEEVLCNTDTSRGLTLILDAPGGDGLAAERIIRACRSYTKKDFEAIVPARAKSAATMVCLGADRILMGKTSELGPIDPQVPMKLHGDRVEWVAAHYDR